MAPKRSKKVDGILVKTTKKVVEEKLTVSVEGKGGNGEEVEEIEFERGDGDKDKKKKLGSEEKKAKNKKNKEEVGGEKSKKKKNKKKKKRGSRNATAGEVSGNYKRYVHMVLKQVHPELGVSSMAMAVIEAMMRDMFERIAGEAARLSKHAQKVTLSSRDIQSAVQLVLPGELRKHAVAEGTKAITNYVTAG